MTRAEMKTSAKERLRGNWGWSVGIAFVYWIVELFMEGLNRYAQYTDGSTVASILVLILLVVISMIGISWQYTSLALIDGKDDESNFNGIAAVSSNGRFGTSFVTWLLVVIFVCLWSILLVIPGIIKLIAYSQTFNIIKDKMDAGQQISASEAITESRKLMDGHKMDFFVLQLSFIGWWILNFVTLGIAGLWVMPYQFATNAKFYRELAGDRYQNVANGDNEKKEDDATFEE